MCRFWWQDRPQSWKGVDWARPWEKPGLSLAQIPVCGKHLLTSAMAQFPKIFSLVFLPPPAFLYLPSSLSPRAI
jgi:hypothetical protein